MTRETLTTPTYSVTPSSTQRQVIPSYHTAQALNPYPIPTPPQPISQGGNPNVPANTYGPMIPSSGAYYPPNFIGPIPTDNVQASYRPNSNLSTTPKPTTPPPNNPPPSNNSGNNGGGNSGPSDAEYDAYGVARGDKGGLDRVKREIAEKESNKPTTYRTPEGWDYQGDENAYMSEINNTFNNVMGYLSQNEGLLNQSRDTAFGQADADLATNETLLGNQRSQADRTIQEQGIQADQKKEDALSQARRLYQQLSTGAKQRFGSMSSAGQGASEILGSELQRNMGGIQQGAMNTERELANAARTIEENFNAGRMQLQQAFQGAKAKIQQDFISALTQINNMRASSEQEKGAARLQALSKVRDQVFQMKQQETSFNQQLEAMRQENLLNFQNYNQTAGAATAAGASTLNNFAPTSTYSTLQANQEQGTDPYMGIIGQSTNTGRRMWDENLGKYVNIN